MTVKLFDLEHITAIADAIRAKTGEGGLMTVQQMPAAIAAIAAGGGETVWKECWLEKPPDAPAALGIDTGIAANFDGRLTVKCRTTIGFMSAPFIAAESSGDRYGVNFLPGGNKLQIFWGSHSDINVTVDRTAFDFTNIIEYTMDRNGLSMTGFKSSGVAATHAVEYSASASGGAAPTFKLFTYARNADINKGIFRKAQIYEGGDTPAYTVVPEVSSSFTARLKITDHALDTVRYVPVPAGFLCHVAGEEAAP